MQRFYHSAHNWFRTVSSQKLLIIASILLVIVLYFAPLYRFIPPFLGIAREFLFSQTQLRGETQVNILILGLGGSKNEPSGLTDTILFTSINRESGKTLLLSMPRDIWLPQIRAKINTAYYYGNQKDGEGLEWSRRFVEEIVGQPVNYVMVISFEGFVKIIDYLGGVDINIEKGFTDTEYPIPERENDLCGGDPKTRCRYETIEYKQGVQHLNGQSALKYARSRHSEGEAGSDFARSRRQQQIIVALRDKVSSPYFFLNPQKIAGLLDLAANSIETDIPQSHFAPFARLALIARDSEVKAEVIPGSLEENVKTGFVYHPRPSRAQDNQWVLIPRADNWQPFQEWVECLLTKENCFVDEYAKSIRD